MFDKLYSDLPPTVDESRGSDAATTAQNKWLSHRASLLAPSSVKRPISQTHATPRKIGIQKEVKSSNFVDPAPISDANEVDSEQYDPAYPNKYDDIIRRMQRSTPPRPPITLQAPQEPKLSGDEMLQRRLRAMEEREKFESGGSEGVQEKRKFAQKIMEKMGWKEGQGLGREGQGIVAPLQAIKQGTKSGIIVAPQPRVTSVTKATKPADFGEPSRILLVELVDGDSDKEWLEQLEETCGQLGSLVALHSQDTRRILCEFETEQDATDGIKGLLNGNVGGVAYKCRFFPLEDFKSLVSSSSGA